jgi:hypothetical protein
VDRSVPLENDVEEETRRNYAKAFPFLLTFVALAGFVSLAEFVDAHPKTVGNTVCEFVCKSFRDGTVTRKQVEDALSAFAQQMFWNPGVLRPAWRLTRRWLCREDVEMRNPISRRMLKAFIAVGFSWGWYAFSASIWLMFHGLLRPEEGISLAMEDIWLSEEWAVGVANLGKTKTYKYAARRQHVLIDEPILLQVLRRLRRFVPRGCRIFPFSPAAFANRLRIIQRAIGMPEWVTPGSFRPGGATFMWLLYRNFEAVRLRGRWAAPGRSLEHYLQECMAYYGEGNLEPRLRDKIKVLADQAMPLVSNWLRS